MPLNRIEQYLGNLRGDGNTIPDKPLNRIEKYLAIMCGEDYEIPKPRNRIEQYLADIAENGGGGGGGSAVLIDKTITANGTYNASSDSADGYKKVVANVANSYSAGDEGKVVSNGALVSQGTQEYTSNGVYDTTLIDEVTVNVSGGGGGLEYEEGTFTPVSDTDRPTITFANAHATVPIFLMMSDVTGTDNEATSSNYGFAFSSFYDYTGEGVPTNATPARRYALVSYVYRGSTTNLAQAITAITALQGSASSNELGYWVSTSGFAPSSASTTRYWRAGRTYKWIAVWKPTA